MCDQTINRSQGDYRDALWYRIEESFDECQPGRHTARVPAFDFPGLGDAVDQLPAADAVAWRISVEPYADDPEDFSDAWARFVATVDLSAVQALIIGQWGESYEVDSSSIVGLIVEQQDRFAALRALFLGDIVPEQQEISWIRQSDVTPILGAFPELVEFRIRGGTELKFPATSHNALRRLTIESGGLPAEVVRGVLSSDFPYFEFLELWLGDEHERRKSVQNRRIRYFRGQRRHYPAVSFCPGGHRESVRRQSCGHTDRAGMPESAV